MKKITFLLMLMLGLTVLIYGQTTIDFETEGDGYTPSATEGSGDTDVFNRTNPNIGGNSTFIWSVEDINLSNPSIVLDQIDISGAVSFTFSIDMITRHFNDWDDSDELLITYSLDGGSYENLMWVENTGEQYNDPAALDTDFDGDGECTYVLPALTTGTGTDGCEVTSSTFETFITDPVAISGSTLDITLQFNGLTAGDEGIYLDNIVITPSASGGVSNPADFSATTADVDQIDLSWIQNGNTDDVMVAWSSDGVFGTPDDGTSYNVNDGITGGGTVIYNGTGTSTNHLSLTSDTRYYYSAWSVDGSDDYSSGVTSDTTTLADEPTTDATNPESSADGPSSITVIWDDATRAPGSYLVKGSDVSAGDIVDPVDGSPEADGMLVQNASAGDGSATFTGLTPGTTYYFKIYPYNGDNGSVNYKTDNPAATSTDTDSFTAPNAWINELHYDNNGGDVDEMIEIVIENVGTYTLSDFQVDLYNGSGGVIYGTKTLDAFTAGNTVGNFTFYTFTYPSNGIQNGPDGMALSYQGTLIPGQFLSYEGTVTATTGPANGLTSTNIGVLESGSTQVGESLQLKGGGLTYDMFYWEWPRDDTPGALNNKQFLSDSYTTWTGTTDNDWATASNWNNGVPDVTMNVIIPDDLTNYPTLSAAGNCIDIRMESGTALVGVNNLTASGTATIERYIDGYSGASDGFHFLSSPVASFTIAGSDFQPASGTDDFFSWDEASTTWLNYYDGLLDSDFVVGKGYLVAYSPDKPGEFTGSFNTASVPKSLSYTPGEGEGWNLLGNPYPSAIDWGLISKTTGVDGTVYVLRGSDNTYVDWNGATGDLTAGHIPVNNGFFVKAGTGSETVIIDPADQVHSTSTFLKAAEEVVENTLIVSISDEEFTNNTYIQFRQDGTTEFDNAIDAYKLFGSSDAPQLFTLLSETEYSINCLPFIEEHFALPMGFLTGTASEYTISADGVGSFTSNSFEVSLEDLETGDIVNLGTDTYTFTSNPDTDDSRFILHFYGATSTDELPVQVDGKIYAYQNTVYVQINDQSTSTYQVDVVNMVGQQIYSNEFVSGGLNSFKLNEKPGVYFVRLRADNKAMVQKVMISK